MGTDEILALVGGHIEAYERLVVREAAKKPKATVTDAIGLHARRTHTGEVAVFTFTLRFNVRTERFSVSACPRGA